MAVWLHGWERRRAARARSSLAAVISDVPHVLRAPAGQRCARCCSALCNLCICDSGLETRTVAGPVPPRRRRSYNNPGAREARHGWKKTVRGSLTAFVSMDIEAVARAAVHKSTH